MPPSKAVKVDVPPYEVRSGEGEARLRSTEWLLTNGKSGFAMGTAAGIPTRRYHGLLVSETAASPQRRVYVNALVEELVLKDKSGHRMEPLSSFIFRSGEGQEVVHPAGWRLIERFEKGAVCRWEIEAGGVRVVKTVALSRVNRGTLVRYEVSPGAGVQVELRVRPLVSMRDFHSTLHRDESCRQFEVVPSGAGLRVRRTDGSGEMYILSEGAEVVATEQWWHNFTYPIEQDRGLGFTEDLFSPGEFVLRPGAKKRKIDATLVLSLETGATGETVEGIEREEVARRRRFAQAAVKEAGKGASAAVQKQVAALAWATDDFVFSRSAQDGEAMLSIVAGYPWFGDWGRDSMISLPGLLLLTGRHEEALGVLKRFAGAIRRGIVPNRFADQDGEPLYNTVDASLWFIVACWRYLKATRDRKAFDAELAPACLEIVHWYRKGTDQSIGMDPEDMMITAGTAHTQLTWMDAARDGVVFTPRHGKAVEINALWCSALAMLSEAAEGNDRVRAADLGSLAKDAAASFRARFWNESRGCCYDVLEREGDGREWRGNGEVRPNQVFAVSVPFSPLTQVQGERVMGVVRDELLTPLAVRTLEPGDPKYRPRFRGALPELDAAYHNGTAWPWLLGPVAEATMRLGGFSTGSRAEAKIILAGITGYLDGWCLGQLPEVFDGAWTKEEPQRAGGCPAQAWSVAETLRVMVMAGRGEG